MWNQELGHMAAAYKQAFKVRPTALRSIAMIDSISRRTLLGATLLSASGTPLCAQSYPTKPLRWIIPFPAAGNYDVTSRLVGEAMGRHLGQTVIPDNRPGAAGIVGMETAANAPADGYTVVMGSFSVLWVAPYLAGKPSMVPLFAPISLLTTVPMVIVTKADGRFADIKAALAEARAKPDTVSIGHAGNGTTNHIGILRLQVNAKVQFNVIPYKGSGPGLTDLMAGQIDLYTDQLTTSLPQAKAGKLRALLVLSPGRIPQLPDVPSLTDIGSAPFDGGTTAGGLRPYRNAGCHPRCAEWSGRCRAQGRRGRTQARRSGRRGAAFDSGRIRGLDEGAGGWR